MSSTPKMIPAIAAARRLRHSRGVRTGGPVRHRLNLVDRRDRGPALPSFLSLYLGSFLGTVRVSHVYVGNRQRSEHGGVGLLGPSHADGEPVGVG